MAIYGNDSPMSLADLWEAVNQAITEANNVGVEADRVGVIIYTQYPNDNGNMILHTPLLTLQVAEFRDSGEVNVEVGLSTRTRVMPPPETQSTSTAIPVNHS